MTVSTCSQCHRPLAPDDEFCSYCGAFVSAPPPKPVASPTYHQGKVSTPYSPSPTNCPACRAPVQRGDDICERCGAILDGVSSGTDSGTPQQGWSTLTACPACQAPVQAGDEFCERCGAVFAAIPSMTAPAIPPAGPIRNFVASVAIASHPARAKRWAANTCWRRCLEAAAWAQSGWPRILCCIARS